MWGRSESLRALGGLDRGSAASTRMTVLAGTRGRNSTGSTRQVSASGGGQLRTKTPGAPLTPRACPGPAHPLDPGTSGPRRGTPVGVRGGLKRDQRLSATGVRSPGGIYARGTYGKSRGQGSWPTRHLLCQAVQQAQNADLLASPPAISQRSWSFEHIRESAAKLRQRRREARVNGRRRPGTRGGRRAAVSNDTRGHKKWRKVRRLQTGPE